MPARGARVNSWRGSPAARGSGGRARPRRASEEAVTQGIRRSQARVAAQDEVGAKLAELPDKAIRRSSVWACQVHEAKVRVARNG